MSVRYTGEATMDEPALRDVERWKDKIEVRLDNRQVFFLFFGSAMVACMLFVLGVIVGKRLESRGRAEAPAIEDPLAVLDRFGVVATTAAPAALTFPRALLGAGASKTLPITPERTDRSMGKQMLTAGAPVLTGLGKAAISPAPPKTAAVVSNTGPTTTVIAAASTPASTSKKLAALPRPLPAPGSEARTAPSAAVRDTALPPRTPVSGAAKAIFAPTADKDKDKDKGKSHFLLQLSSFQERGEADTFARRFASQNAYVVATEIPGKGTWYRVRVGNYGNLQEATTAKAAFEREHNVIAYVAGGGAK